MKATHVQRYIGGKSKNPGKFAGRIDGARAEADVALEMGLQERRDKYCFLSRFKGRWGLPWTLDLSSPDAAAVGGSSEVAEEVGNPDKSEEVAAAKQGAEEE